MPFDEEAQPTVDLRHGVKVPMLGIGTTHHGGYVHDTLVYALQEVGYRHVDTAKRYGVERFIGQAIKESAVDRQDIFLTTKLWPKEYGFESAQKSAETSMSSLCTDYLDMYMLHWPICPSDVVNAKETIAEAWRGLEVLLDAEKVRCIGVSNFQVDHLTDLIESASVVPHVNQCEFHPFQNPAVLRDFCQQNSVAFEGHCPLAKGKLLHEKSIEELARRRGVTAAQLLIRWSLQNGVITIPKSTKKERVLENFQAIRFELSESDMNFLNGLHQDMRIVRTDNFLHRLDEDLPDGYKMAHFSNQLPSLEQANASSGSV